jgi:hypothetical protein
MPIPAMSQPYPSIAEAVPVAASQSSAPIADPMPAPTGSQPIADALPAPAVAHADAVGAAFPPHEVVPTSSAHSLEDVLSGIGANLANPATLPYLMAAAAGAAAMGITYARAFGPACQLSGGPVPLLFSSIRLLPCTAASAVEGGVSAVEGIAGRVGGSLKQELVNAKDELAGVKAGFQESHARAQRVAAGLRDELNGGQGAGDNRLLMQLAMLLGLAYVAFLTVWFWGTRVRWNGRS